MIMIGWVGVVYCTVISGLLCLLAE